MTNGFGKMGRAMAKCRKLVLSIVSVFVIAAGVWGTGVFHSLTGGSGFDDPGSQSVHADNVLAGALGRYSNDAVVLYDSPDMTVDNPAFSSAVQNTIAKVSRGTIVRLESYWTAHNAVFVSKDRHATYVTVQLSSSNDQTRVKQWKAIKAQFVAPGLTTRFGGLTPMSDQVNSQGLRDLMRAEIFSIPVLLVLLLVIFRSVVAASLPLIVGIVTALGAMTLLRLITAFAQISSFAIEVVTILGLGLAIDYALFIVNRFREELVQQTDVMGAITRTMATAGRTIVFSGLAVAVSFLGVLIFPSRFLQSIGYAGAVTALFAIMISLVLLPALLYVAGMRVNGLRAHTGKQPISAMGMRGGRWYRMAHAVMRHPTLSAIIIVGVLLAAGLPLLHANWARPGDWVQPATADARTVTHVLAERFTADPAKQVTVVTVLPNGEQATNVMATLDQYAGRLATIKNVTGAKVTGTHANQARLTLTYAVDPQSLEARQMVFDIRAAQTPAEATAYATGMPASRVDIVYMVLSRLPLLGLYVLTVTFIVLFLAFGSVVLPFKSVVMNLLSLSASFGAIVWIFQDGHLSNLLNFVPIGAIDIDFPVLIVAIAFGLAMDYEVFLLSRIHEEYRRSGDTREATAVGVQHTASIITSAALLMLVVVAGFFMSQLTFMKVMGVGLGLAVIVDATIVRALLVPATMVLLGKRAWWAPAPLAHWWQKHGIKEEA